MNIHADSTQSPMAGGDPLSAPGAADLLRIIGMLILSASAVIIAVNYLSGGEFRHGALASSIVGSLVLLAIRFGRIRWAAAIICLGLIFVTLTSAQRVLGLSSPIWTLAAQATVVGGWLLGKRTTLLLAITASAGAIWLYWMQTHGHVPAGEAPLNVQFTFIVASIWMSAAIGVGTANHFSRRQLQLLRDSHNQLQKAHGTLQKSEVQMREVFNAVQVCIGVMDRETQRLIYVNDFMCQVYGYDQAGMLTIAPENLFPPKTRDFAMRLLQEALHGRGPLNGVVAMLRSDGSVFHSNLRNSLIEFAGHPCMLCVGSDVSNMVRTHAELAAQHNAMEKIVAERTRELETARRAAEEASNAKSRFLATMSHEIRTPINAVLGMTYLCLQTDVTKQQRNYLEKAQRSGYHLLAVINDILDYSRVEAGKLHINNIPFDLDDMLAAVVDMVKAKADEKGLALEISLSEPLPRRWIGDPQRISQILLNYLSNSIKFTEQGRVKIAVSRQAAPDGHSTLLRFEVSDSGAGMSPEQTGRLFNSFEQLDGSTTRRHGGSGLGLVISKGLAELMGGEVGVSSATGHGSTFWATCLVQPAESREADPDTVGTSPSETVPSEKLAPGLRVLLVEDNEINREVAVELLEDVGCVVDVACDGEQALRMVLSAAQPTYDAVLMDLHMPVLDGISATRAIRQHPYLLQMPIIAMTADVMPEDRQRCLDAGMIDHISKPIDPALLYKILARHTSGRA
jgi:PAS domain S-box-containing protein